MKLVLFIICTLALSCQNQNSQKPSTSENTIEVKDEPISKFGYWQIPIESRNIKEKNEIVMSGNYVFLLDSNTITISLLTMKEHIWKSEDDYYKLESKWEHDSLFYLPPFGNWTYLAAYDGTNFTKQEDGIVFNYNKVNIKEINKIDSAILKIREIHNYNTKPTDRVK